MAALLQLQQCLVVNCLLRSNTPWSPIKLNKILRYDEDILQKIEELKTACLIDVCTGRHERYSALRYLVIMVQLSVLHHVQAIVGITIYRKPARQHYSSYELVNKQSVQTRSNDSLEVTMTVLCRTDTLLDESTQLITQTRIRCHQFIYTIIINIMLYNISYRKNKCYIVCSKKRNCNFLIKAA